MADRPDFLANSLIVAAHPDDELLWFGSILPQVDRVAIVYRDFWAKPALGAARAAAVAEFPRGGVELIGLSESGATGCANWDRPVESPEGLALSFEAHRREMARSTRKAIVRLRPKAAVLAEASVREAYAANARRLAERLRPLLRRDMNVFSHNPWGEYGHEEHVQLFRVLQGLRREIGFTLWMSNYCTERSLPLAMRYFRRAPGPYVRLPVDKPFADRVAEVYKRHGCWTWADDWAWFDEECFMEAPEAGATAEPQRHLCPLNFFTIDGERGRDWVPAAIGITAASAALIAAADF